MTSQEARARWELIRRIDYTGALSRCSRCGSVPQLYAVDPAGLWIKHFLPGETFIAARCACGMTGELKGTGRNALGTYIDARRAAELAANAWNAEQLQQATSVYGHLKGEAL